MKSEKVEEMTIEEKVQKFHERHPDYPKEFKSPAEEHLLTTHILFRMQKIFLKLLFNNFKML
ncbi:MAG TPA: hypothetical protein ENN33_10210 [Ignavibacteria bacterium]|nr:hypothetical protein [Ignavibacteria bacterium]